MQLNLNRQIILTFIILVLTVLFFQFTTVDEKVQNLFYNFSTHKWILDRDAQPYKFIFYDGLKKFLIVVGIGFLVSLFLKRFKSYKKALMIVVFSAILVPVVVGGLKKYTNMPCPKNRVEYGGTYPHTYIWQHYPKDFKKSKTRCWPAGHASGGFALMSLFFLFKSRRNKLLGLVFGISLGWMMGLYKMFIGDHFLSHTVITMILAWFVIVVIARIVYGKVYKL